MIFKMSYNSMNNLDKCPLVRDGKCRVYNDACYDYTNNLCEPIRRAYNAGFTDCHDLINTNKVVEGNKLNE